LFGKVLGGLLGKGAAEGEMTAIDESASIPVGRLGEPMGVPGAQNADTVIGGRTYIGHALDSMQSRGFGALGRRRYDCSWGVDSRKIRPNDLEHEPGESDRRAQWYGGHRLPLFTMNNAVVSVSGRTGKITIEVSRYERPDAEQPSGKNWLVGKIQVQVGPFLAAYNVRLETYDFADFCSEIEKMLGESSATARFECAEEWLKMSIAVATRGAVTVRGVAKSLDCLGTNLSFSFNSDQSCINQLFPDQRELELNPESKT
jgi:hypothetical protein